MSIATDQGYMHLGETRGMADHDHDLVHDLSRRLDCLWRYDQYIANAADHPELQAFWLEDKAQEQANINKLKKLIRQHVQKNCF